MRILTWPWCLLFLLTSIDGVTQEKLVSKYRFETDERLDRVIGNRAVKQILQDSTGMLWFATTGGLIKFNGIEAQLFSSELRDSTGTSRDYLLALAEDSNGFLWIGTYGQGLIRLDTRSQSFSFYLKSGTDSTSLPDDNVFDILKAGDGTVWFATFGGLCKYDPVTDSFKSYQHNPGDPHSLSHNDVFRLTEDGYGNIWLATYRGIDKFDPETEIFTNYHHDPENTNSIYGDNVVSIAVDGRGHVWSGSYLKGLNRLDPQTGKIDRYLDGESVYDINFRDHIAWLGTGHGLIAFDTEAGKTVNKFTYHNNDNFSIRSSVINNITIDRSGVLWIATWAHGVNKLNLEMNELINFYPFEESRINSINDFYDDGKFLWLALESGIIRMNKSTQEYTIHDLGVSVNSIVRDKNGDLWLGTYGGLYKYNPESKKLRSFPEFSEVDGFNHQITSVRIDLNGIVWIGSWDGGLSKFDPKNRLPELITYPGLKTDDVDVMSLSIDSQGEIWVCTQGRGLLTYDPAKRSFVNYFTQGEVRSQTLGSANLVYEDEGHHMWIASREGLFKLTKERGIVRRFDMQDGLISLSVTGLLEDAQKKLWIITQEGISRLDLESETIQNLSNFDFQRYNPTRSCAKDSLGNFYLGGTLGLNVFQPDRLLDNDFVPGVSITSFQLMNQQVNLFDYFEPSEDHGFSVRLPYKFNIVAFEFTAFDFREPEGIKYKYKLDGFNSDWIETDAHHRVATYTNLAHGSYIFRVASTNSQGYWVPNELTIQVTIEPPFWLTSWFRSLLGLLAIVSFVVYDRIRNNNVKKQNRRLEELVKKRTESLDRVNKERIEFLNIFAHDIVDPLISIELLASRLRENIYKFSSEDIEKSCQRIEFNTSRISSLTNNILKAGLLESNRIQLTNRPFDLVQIIEHVMQEYNQRAAEKNIKVTLKCNESSATINTDRSAFVQVIGNLLSNAIKYSEAGREVHISVMVLDDACLIKVKDEGQGFAEEDMPHVFEKYKKLSAKPTAGESSSGLGLFIVKMLVEKMNGEISFESEKGIGTVFSIRLPLASTESESLKED